MNCCTNWRKCCTKRLGVPGAWPCILDEGHRGPHVTYNGQASAKIWDGSGYVDDPDYKPGGREGKG